MSDTHPDTVTPEQRAEIQKRADAATKGPWKPVRSATCGHLRAEHNHNQDPRQEWTDADLAFIAHARTDIPALLRHIAAREKEAQRRSKALAVILDTATSGFKEAGEYLTYAECPTVASLHQAFAAILAFGDKDEDGEVTFDTRLQAALARAEAAEEREANTLKNTKAHIEALLEKRPDDRGDKHGTPDQQIAFWKTRYEVATRLRLGFQELSGEQTESIVKLQDAITTAESRERRVRVVELEMVEVSARGFLKAWHAFEISDCPQNSREYEELRHVIATNFGELWRLTDPVPGVQSNYYQIITRAKQ